MSSIAYITDKNMIEFHRLNGNSTINFWRPSMGKRFTDFHPGDLLFFLAKGTERGTKKEKGLIGYGRYISTSRLSFKQMWKQYGMLNGYLSDIDFKEAIIKVSKAKTLAPQLSGLVLTDIVFFQAPVYLSELGIKISNNVESYIYLDKEDSEATVRILKKASQTGVDAWTSAVSHHAPMETVFDEDLIRHILTYKLTELPNIDNIQDMNKGMKILNHYKNQNPDTQWIDDRKQELFKYDETGFHITVALVTSKNDLKRKLLFLMGKLQLLSIEAQQIASFSDKQVFLEILTDAIISMDWINLLKQANIEIIVLKPSI